MNENIQMFLQKLAQDPEVIAKFNATRDPDEAYALASSLQDGFTKEEFISAMTQVSAALENQDLSDEDLEKISGGGSTERFISALSTAMTSAIAAGAASI